MLEEILANYNGTLIVVSHDRDFLDQTVTKILAFEGNGEVEGYIGGYTDYLEARGQENAAMSSARTPVKPKAEEPKQPLQKMSYKLQYELEQLPHRINDLQHEIRTLENLLMNPDLYMQDAAAFQKYSRRLPEARQLLAAAEHRWIELEDQRITLLG